MDEFKKLSMVSSLNRRRIIRSGPFVFGAQPSPPREPEMRMRSFFLFGLPFGFWTPLLMGGEEKTTYTRAREREKEKRIRVNE